MRTTVDLDADVDARLRAIARERGMSLRSIINETLRIGTELAVPDAGHYTLPSRPLGVRPGIDLDKAPRLESEMEDDESAHKLELRAARPAVTDVLRRAGLRTGGATSADIVTAVRVGHDRD